MAWSKCRSAGLVVRGNSWIWNGREQGRAGSQEENRDKLSPLSIFPNTLNLSEADNQQEKLVLICQTLRTQKSLLDQAGAGGAAAGSGRTIGSWQCEWAVRVPRALRRLQSFMVTVFLLPLRSHISLVVNPKSEPHREWNSRIYHSSWSKLTRLKPPQGISKTLWTDGWGPQI